MDPRAQHLARILIDHSLRVKKNDRVLIATGDFTAIDLVKQCQKLCLERGAHPHVDICGLHFQQGRSDAGGIFRHALEHGHRSYRRTMPEPVKASLAWATKILSIVTVHKPAFLDGLDSAHIMEWKGARSPFMHAITRKDWVLTKFPTVGQAKLAGMSLPAFTDFFYKACVVDYAAQGRRIKKLQGILDKGSWVHIVAPGTDLRLGIRGRLASGAESGRHNIPDGECFLGPRETQTEGHITFELPQCYDGKVVEGIRLEFKGGKIVKFSAKKNASHLRTLLEAHPGNRRFGELGIGMNDRITRYMQDILFDEKIMGTVHLAIGRSYDYVRGGGKNKGTIHWDLVKDLRSKGTRVTVDGRAIIADGKVLV